MNKCHMCESDAEDFCESCGQPVCLDCCVPYNQFSQVDYALCTECGEMKCEESDIYRMEQE